MDYCVADVACMPRMLSKYSQRLGEYVWSVLVDGSGMDQMFPAMSGDTETLIYIK